MNSRIIQAKLTCTRIFCAVIEGPSANKGSGIGLAEIVDPGASPMGRWAIDKLGRWPRRREGKLNPNDTVMGRGWTKKGRTITDPAFQFTKCGALN